MRRLMVGLMMLALARGAAAQDVITADKIYLGTPSLTSGSGAPSASEPDGSWYYRTNGQWYYRVGGAWVTLVDTSGKIPALSSTYFSSLSGANLTSLPAGQLTGTIASGVQDAITRLGTVTSGTWNAGAGTFAGNILPSATDAYNLGSYDKLWSQAFISVLNAIVFQQSTATLFGGYSIIGKSAGAFAADVASAATTIDFGQTMTPSDFVLVRASDTSGTVRAEYLQVGTLVSGTTYNVTRDLASANSPDPTWASGTPYLVLGATNDGRIEMLAYDGKPRILFRQQGATYNAATDRVAIGNLNGSFGYVTDIYGLAAGLSTGAWVKVDPTNGLRLGYNATTNFSVDASGNAALSGSAITLGPPSGTYGVNAAVAFSRPAGSNGGGTYALYTLDGTTHQYLDLENTVISETASARVAHVGLIATGYTGAAATTYGQVDVQSGVDVGGSGLNSRVLLDAAITKPTGDLATVIWTDYSATSTITGWSSFAGKKLSYKRVGKLVFVAFDLEGTSNATSASFTLPVASGAGMTTYMPLAFGYDNGVALATPGYCAVANGGSTVTCYSSGAGATWTAANTKMVAGQFVYEAGS